MYLHLVQNLQEISQLSPAAFYPLPSIHEMGTRMAATAFAPRRRGPVTLNSHICAFSHLLDCEAY
jgi:hypothetical protein